MLSIAEQVQQYAQSRPLEVPRPPSKHIPAVLRNMKQNKLMTNQMLMDKTGLTREQVREALNEMAREGLVEKRGKNKFGRIDWVRV